MYRQSDVYRPNACEFLANISLFVILYFQNTEFTFPDSLTAFDDEILSYPQMNSYIVYFIRNYSFDIDALRLETA